MPANNLVVLINTSLTQTNYVSEELFFQVCSKCHMCLQFGKKIEHDQEMICIYFPRDFW